MAKVDIHDVIDSIEEALNYAEKIRDGEIDEASGKVSALKAIGEIRRGDYDEAITRLEREFLPKWQSTEGCRTAYRKTTGIDSVSREVGREIEKAVA